MGSIYLLQEGDKLVEMSEQTYDSESLLQELIAKYPSLLAGDQINSEAPRRWLLVSRELSLASEQDGAGRWYVDHLFLDQEAIPTLIEVKRSSDTRIRREVIGQMLDYAANCVTYWPIEEIHAAFDRTSAKTGVQADELLRDFLEGESTPEEFWQQVKTNLQAGRIRLVFVGDEIPAELRRVVEFLNTQMDPAEVLAIEIKQFVGEKLKTLVPRVIGQTEQAVSRKAADKQPGRQWDEKSFLEALQLKGGPLETTAAREVLAWSRSHKLRESWGQGKQDGSFSPVLDFRGVPYWFIIIYTYGRVEMQFQHMRQKPPFDSDAKRLEFIERLNAINGITIPLDAQNRRPSIPLAALTDATALKQFLAVLDWGLEQVRTS